MPVLAPVNVGPEEAIANLPRVDKAEIPEIVSDLVEWIGAGLTAMAGGVNETRFVRLWVEGQTKPRRPATLRAAWRAAYIITTLAGSEAAKAWFMGQNSDFNFAAPVRVLQKNTDEARSAVVRSAVHFATT